MHEDREYTAVAEAGPGGGAVPASELQLLFDIYCKTAKFSDCVKWAFPI